MVTVKQLYLYPVKSLRGFSLNSAKLTTKGFDFDRFWLIVNNQGKFLTQRQLPSMVLIHTDLNQEHLILKKEGMDDLWVPKIFSNIETKPFTTQVWKDQCRVVDEGHTASIWLEQALGLAGIRLVRMIENFQRPLSKANFLGEQTSTFFADAAPFLICNQASLEALNQHLEKNDIPSVSIENFRPNIVIEGLDAFQEHRVQSLEHPKYVFKHCYPCQRCVIPTIDINTGKRHPKQQPFSLLAEINSMPNNPKAPAFGENTILTKGISATIAIGNVLEPINHS